MLHTPPYSNGADHRKENSMLHSKLVCRVLLVTVLSTTGLIADEQERHNTITFHGYPNCILLENATTRVVLCPHSGGRVLEYAYRGKNALYLEEQHTGQAYQPGKPASMSAGRFDIGPENKIPKRPLLWSGQWTGKRVGERTARLTSPRDQSTGTQLIREFRLAAEGTHLECKQTIVNISDQVTEWCHWSRTFARGNGICIIPLQGISKFPHHYVMYENGNLINTKPTDPQIRVREGCLEITGVPANPKLGMDSQAGWFAYLMKNDLLFVKKFAVYPERVYNEVAGLTISIWYPADRRVELEPIGPRERLRPGESAAFTEHWYLQPMAFPTEGQNVDLQQVKALAKQAH